MDLELAFALIILWTTTTTFLLLFGNLWISNQACAFHPHSVDITHRHDRLYVVSGCTTCHPDMCVKSISAFVAPRGSTSAKYFTVLTTIVSVVGALGCHRWHRVGDANQLEAYLAIIGFLSLKTNSNPSSFLTQKNATAILSLISMKKSELYVFLASV